MVAEHVISIHAPHTGRDLHLIPEVRLGRPISIHAPHTGRDRSAVSLPRSFTVFQSTRPIRGATRPPPWRPELWTDFNPRAPYGARLRLLDCAAGSPDISIHAPHTGRDCRPHRCRLQAADFNPRAPYGARRLCPNRAPWWNNFNPRAPYGARLRLSTPMSYSREISIHAPHTGRDVRRYRLGSVSAAFQSTRPIRGATPAR